VAVTRYSPFGEKTPEQRRSGVAGAMMLALVACLALGFCSCVPPAAPSALPSDTAYFAWYGGPTAGQRAFGVAAWERCAACVGIDPHKLTAMPIYVLDGIFWCGPDGAQVSASGCTYFGGVQGQPLSVHVKRKDFEIALPNELLHVALHLAGEDPGYTNPRFGACKWW
jgi:hypothetical protein